LVGVEHVALQIADKNGGTVSCLSTGHERQHKLCSIRAAGSYMQGDYQSQI